MARTAQQQCYEVVVVKNTLQRTLGRLPTRQAISDMFYRNIKLADGKQEDYIENFVKDSMTIYERICECDHIGPCHCGTREAGRPELSVDHRRQAGCVGIKILQTKRKGSGPWAHCRTITLTTSTCPVACPSIFCTETKVMWTSLFG